MAAPIYGFVPKDRHAEAACPAPADRADTPDKLYIAIDGTGVPMVPVAVAGRPAKSDDALRCRQASNRFDRIWMPAAQPDLTA